MNLKKLSSFWRGKGNEKCGIFRSLALSLCMLTFAGAYAQTGKVTIKLNNAPIKTLFTTIEKQTDYRFSYRDADIAGKQNITVSAENKELKDLLTQELAQRNLTYKMSGNVIMILPAQQAGSSVSSDKKITGVVKDAHGEPVIGANVTVKGQSSIGTITDIDGRFTLDVPADAVLQISYIGFASQDIDVGNQRELVIALKEDTEMLDEVVVVGYGVQKKVNLTGSVSSISSEELESKPVAFTSHAIAGLTPGLSVVQSSGRPGVSASVRIRGTGTFSSAGTDPLVLIDGLSGSLDDVNPSDIESISVLKDAASASIYGNRAANGVILIETKKGKAGKITVSYNSYFGWQRPTELPEFLPSWEYATYYNEAMRNMGNNEVYTTEQIQKYRDGSDPDNYPNVNHLDWLLHSGSGFQHRHTVGIQGGNEKLTYNLSLGYMKQAGITAKTDNKRYTGLFTLKSELAKGLSFNMSINAYINDYDAPYSNATNAESIDAMMNFAVREGPIYAGQKTDGSFGYQDNYSPEAWLAGDSFYQSQSSNIAVSGQLLWETPVEGLSFSGKAGLDYFSGYYKTFGAETYFDENKTVGPSKLSIKWDNNFYRIYEALARYNRTFGQHDLGILLGASAEETTYKSIDGARNTFPKNTLHELVSGDASTSTNSSDQSSYALASFFGRFNYAWNERYLLEANVRYDGSSRFAKKNRWGLFPSVSAGWRISEEPFWEKFKDTVNNLKLRASWGKLGNQNIGTYPYQQVYYTSGWEYPLGNPSSLQPGAMLNEILDEDISWETTAVTDVGLDFGLFNNKLTGSIDYFYKYTSDILSGVEYTYILGRGVGQSNVGAVSNSGVEVMLNYNGQIGNDFRFSVSPNFTYVKNAVEKLADGRTEDINNGRIVGQPLGIIYGYLTDGLFVDQAEIDAAPEQIVAKSQLKPGYVKYKDISGPDGVPDGQVDANYDRVVLGSTTPKFYYGLTLNAQYKGFDFSALLQGQGGHKRLIGSYMAYAFYNGGQIQRWQVENRWTEANPNKWADYPRLETLNQSNSNLQTSDYWVRNASFLRIKNIQLGYSFPKSLISKVGLTQARIYVSCENLHSFNSFYPGWDPENEIGTGDAPSFYPITAIYSFGVNLKF